MKKSKNKIVSILNIVSIIWFVLFCFGSIFTFIFEFNLVKLDLPNFEIITPNKNGYQIPVRLTIFKNPDSIVKYTLKDTITAISFYKNDSVTNKKKSKNNDDTVLEKSKTVYKWVATENQSMPKFYKKIDIQSVDTNKLIVPNIERLQTNIYIRAKGKTKWVNFLLSLNVFIPLLFFVYISFIIMRLFYHLNKGISFSYNLSRNVKKIGIAIIAIQILFIILGYINNSFFSNIILLENPNEELVKGAMNFQFNCTNNFDSYNFLFGLAFIVLAQLFKHGQKIENENSLTI